MSAAEPPLVAFAPSHLEGALRLSQEAGWPHRLDDWALVAAVSQGVAVLDGDRVAATGLCTLYGEHARFSMVLVGKSLRGRGIGRQVMAALAGLAGNRSVSLVATADGKPLYERLGFRPTGAIVQYQGLVRSPTGTVGSVHVAEPGAADAIAAIDRRATGMDRSALMRCLADRGTVLLAEGGFAVLRDFGRGRVLGPLIARDESTAGSLIAAAARQSEGQLLRIDTPCGARLGPQLETLGLSPAGGGTAMRKGPPPAAPDGFSIYALASQALG